MAGRTADLALFRSGTLSRRSRHMSPGAGVDCFSLWLCIRVGVTARRFIRCRGCARGWSIGSRALLHAMEQHGGQWQSRKHGCRRYGWLVGASRSVGLLYLCAVLGGDAAHALRLCDGRRRLALNVAGGRWNCGGGANPPGRGSHHRGVGTGLRPVGNR
jgi:hypothetical protein